MKTKVFSPRGRLDNGGHMHFIDTAYFICIILVVFAHGHPLTSDWWGTWYSDLNAFIYSFHMPMFFFIGGYLMVFSRSIDELGFGKWAAGKLVKFGVPYLVLSLLALVPKAMLDGLADPTEASVGFLLKTLFIVPRQGVWGHFWFISTFLVTELYWGLWRGLAKTRAAAANILFAAGMTAYAAMLAWPVYTDYFQINDIRVHAVFYPLGAVLAMMKPVLWDKKWKNILNVILPLIPAFFLYPYGNYRIKTFPLAKFALALALLWSVWNIAVLIGQKRSRGVHFVVRDSFPVFLYSWPAQAACGVVLEALGVYWVTSVVILFVVGLVFPLALANGYRRLKFVQCRFLDDLFGVRTVS